jgi:hypothetical protein
MRKTAVFAAIAAIVGIANLALAGAQVQLKSSEQAQIEAKRKAFYDHPTTQVMPAEGVKVVIKTDSIMHSCCMPPNLVVAGEVTNTGAQPVSYVKMFFNFEDASGKSVYEETVYNTKAASLGDDEAVRHLLNETPHFDALQPGSTDHFSFVIPTTMLPRFAKVELYPYPVSQ